MPTLEILYHLALAGTSAGMPIEESIDVEEHLSSSSSTPIPAELGIIRSDSTASSVPISDAAQVVAAAGRVITRLAFLQTNPDDEAIVDELLRERLATKGRRPIGLRR
jgi:hypothetical protein